jgi:hypothetical protein
MSIFNKVVRASYFQIFKFVCKVMVQNQLIALNAAIDYFAGDDAGNLALANGEISLLDRQVGYFLQVMVQNS